MEKISFLESTEYFTDMQNQTISKMLDFISSDKKVLIVEGGSGTGKSVVLFETFLKIQKRVNSGSKNNFLIVNHAEMLRAYKNAAKKFVFLNQKMFLKPTTFINQMNHNNTIANIVLIDEAHLLLTEPDKFNHFNFENQLDEIMKKANKIIIIVDFKQVLRSKSLWNKKKFFEIIGDNKYEYLKLSTQFRMLDTNQKMISWIDGLTNKREIYPLHLNGKFEFKIFNDLESMFELIKQRDNEFGMSRMLSTIDFPYVLSHGTWYVTDGVYKIPWDKSYSGNVPWALRPDTINEVGSVYTIQGFDLNYAGVVLGPSIKFNRKTNRIDLVVEQYEDKTAYKKLNDKILKEEIILNTVNILLKRARKGLFIYAVDSNLREFLFKMIN